jgi:hypothetical protein
MILDAGSFDKSPLLYMNLGALSGKAAAPFRGRFGSQIDASKFT